MTQYYGWPRKVIVIGSLSQYLGLGCLEPIIKKEKIDEEILIQLSPEDIAIVCDQQTLTTKIKFKNAIQRLHSIRVAQQNQLFVVCYLADYLILL